LSDPPDQHYHAAVAARMLKIWFDHEADYLEVLFDQREGFFRETANDQVMEKIDSEGNLLGFSVQRVSALAKAPLELVLSRE
jgi:hypothetical protein